jgi:thioredoxin reductase/bacterioferritin-associated ferredoxin
MSNIKELVIIGAGPAGIEAAITAANSGVDVTIIDSAPLPGGQYFKQLPPQFVVDQVDSHNQKGINLINELNKSRVTIYSETIVWGIFESPIPDMWHLTLHGPTAPARMDARYIILATGAYDSSIPFPGWDLPGVITAGAALTIIKNQRVLPGKRILLSGSGPLQLAAAAQLCQAGAEVVAVLECTVSLVGRGLQYLPAVWGQWARIKEGFGYFKTLIGARVPYRLGWTVISVHGKDRVQEVVIAKLDRNGKPILQSKQTISVDTVVVGYGLTPATELSRQVNCEMQFIDERGGFVPKRSEIFETTLSGIFAIGDCAGIGGAGMSMIEGRIAGSVVSFKTGHITRESLSRRISKEKTALAREHRFAELLGDLFAPSKELYQLANNDTIICRCEQITLAEIREAIAIGAQSLPDIKNLTRSGMGNCQGRTCGSIIARILAQETGRPLQESQYNNIRPPIHPLPLNVIEEFQTLSNKPGNQENLNHE